MGVGRGQWSEVKWKSLSHVRFCDPMNYTVHGILQARILEWVAFPFSRGSSQPRDWTQVSCLAGRSFTSWVTKGADKHPPWTGKTPQHRIIWPKMSTGLRNSAPAVAMWPQTAENVIHQSPQLLGSELHHGVCTPSALHTGCPEPMTTHGRVPRVPWRSPAASRLPNTLAKPWDSTAVSDTSSHFPLSFSPAQVRLAPPSEDSPSVFQFPPSLLPRHFPK